MMTRNAYALNMAYVMQRAPVKPERAFLEANMGGDKKPSHEYFHSGHGKTVIAEAFIPDDRIERVLHTTAADLEALSWAGTHGAVASGMQSVAFTPATAIAAVFAATGQDLGMVGTSSMAHGTARRVEGGLHASIRFPGLEVGTIGGGTTLPSARDWLASIGCAGAGKVYRFAQIVAAAALCLEISASASMATAGSENFFTRPPRARRACGDRARLQLRRRPTSPQFERVYGPEGDWAQFFRTGSGLRRHGAPSRRRDPRPLPRRRPLGVARGLQRVRRREPRRVHAPRRRDGVPLRPRAPDRDVRERLVDGSAAAGAASRPIRKPATKQLRPRRQSARAVPAAAAVEELRPARPREPDDVLDVGRAGGEGSDRRGVREARDAPRAGRRARARSRPRSGRLCRSWWGTASPARCSGMPSSAGHAAVSARLHRRSHPSLRAALRSRRRGGYQPRVSSSWLGSSVAVEMPTIASPRPSDTRASTAASM